jgi:hypothetical protein
VDTVPTVYSGRMPRSARAKPRDLVPTWPEGPATDPVAEVARRFALKLREAIGADSVRAVAARADLHHSTLLSILDGRTWPDLETIAKIERGLGADLWPGRVK